MLDIIRKRRSVRHYLPQSIEQEKVDEILKSAMFAPSARHTQAWEFVVVRDKQTILKLASMKAHSQFAEGADVIIVICSKHFDYWLQDVSIVAAHIYLEAINQGLGTCCVEVFESKTYDKTDAEEYIRNVLDIPNDIHVFCLMPIGYPDPAFPFEEHQDSEFKQEKIHEEKW